MNCSHSKIKYKIQLLSKRLEEEAQKEYKNKNNLYLKRTKGLTKP